MNTFRKMVLTSGIVTLLAAVNFGAAREIKLESSSSEVAINQSTVVGISTRETLGTHPTIMWTSSIGKITPITVGMKEYRADRPEAVFTSETPGVAVITATLNAADGTVLMGNMTVTVRVAVAVAPNP